MALEIPLDKWNDRWNIKRKLLLKNSTMFFCCFFPSSHAGHPHKKAHTQFAYYTLPAIKLYKSQLTSFDQLWTAAFCCCTNIQTQINYTDVCYHFNAEILPIADDRQILRPQVLIWAKIYWFHYESKLLNY